MINKNIIITGGSKGIGFEISKSILKNNNVIIVSSNQINLDNAKKELDKLENKGKCYFYKLDISNINDVDIFMNWIKNNFENIHGLVNCAGIYGPIGKTNEIDLNYFQKTININFLGTVYMTTKFINLYNNVSYKRKIIIFSGGGASSIFPNYTAYSTSKISLVKFAENLSNELKDDNVDINCISPGFIITDIHKETLKNGEKIVGKNFYNKTLENIKKGGDPIEKPVNLTNFLLSSKSDNISGKLISAIWDPWENNDFQELLKTDIDIATLKRIDKKYFDRI
jgi:3-oxoacyl-[acyl-carrier protein] reductase